MKQIVTLGLIATLSLFPARPALAHSTLEVSSLDSRPPVSEQVRELSEELSRVFVEEIQQFLDHELDRLRQGSAEDQARIEKQLREYEGTVAKNPRDPETHYALGELYDRTGEGAQAIIHMMQAERLFIEKKDQKGLAESRRNLRKYFARYDFRPEDFSLSQ